MQTKPVDDLREFIKEGFAGNNEIKYFISPRGNQRIEIQDKSNNEIWRTLEATTPPDKGSENDYNEIAKAMLSGLVQELQQTNKKLWRN